jgi:pyruvate decarboxylase
MVPVLHIVGAPSTIQQKTRPLLHHTLGDGRLFISLIQVEIHLLTKFFRFEAYENAAALFTISQANILDKKDAASQIDKVITHCITQVWSLFPKMYLLSRNSRLVPCI